MRRCAIAVLGLALAGCSEPAREPPQKAVAPHPKPSDESRRFPMKNQVKIELVQDKLLDKDFLPGGNLAEYKLRGKAYQQFLIRAEAADRAALLLFDFKNAMEGAKFVPHMGAFSGRDGGKPVYVLQKGPFLAGFVGLEEREAEALAREFAARLD